MGLAFGNPSEYFGPFSVTNQLSRYQMAEKPVSGLINSWMVWASKIVSLTSLHWLNTNKRLSLKCGHNKAGIWFSEEIWMTGKFPEYLNCLRFWRVFKVYKQARIIYGGRGTTKVVTRWKKDTNRKLLVAFKTSNGLGSKSGGLKYHTKWHSLHGY